MNSKILSFHNRLVNNEITLKEYYEYIGKNIHKIEFSNSFMVDTIDQIDFNQLQQKVNANKNNLLFGVPYTLKDNFMTKGIVTTSGSKFLKDFIPPYNATVYDLLKEKECCLVAKIAMDEFGLGGTGLFSFHAYVRNVYNKEHMTGGSSSGSVNAVAADCCLFSLGTDTGDSVRRPSSFLGTVGFKPTYGLISRYGVAPYSPSLDHVGIIANYVADCAIVMQTLAKLDEKDYTSYELSNSQFFSNLKEEKNITLNVIDGVEQYLSTEVIAPYQKAITNLQQNGIKIKKIKIDWEIIKMISPVYKILTYAEANSCYANLTGVTFGTNFDKDIRGFFNVIKNNRTKGFGKQIKRRFIIGAYITKSENYQSLFMKSKKYRTFLINFNNKLLENADGYILPGASSIAPKIVDVENGNYKPTLADDFLQLANFASTPSITIPLCYVKGLPFGININARIKEDQKLLNIALRLENIFKFKKEEIHD